MENPVLREQELLDEINDQPDIKEAEDETDEKELYERSIQDESGMAKSNNE